MHGENASLMYMKPNTLTKRDIVDTLPKLPMELLDLSPSVFDTALYIHLAKCINNSYMWRMRKLIELTRFSFKSR